jgi:hypothetical protein
LLDMKCLMKWKDKKCNEKDVSIFWCIVLFINHTVISPTHCINKIILSPRSNNVIYVNEFVMNLDSHVRIFRCILYILRIWKYNFSQSYLSYSLYFCVRFEVFTAMTMKNAVHYISVYFLT